MIQGNVKTQDISARIFNRNSLIQKIMKREVFCGRKFSILVNLVIYQVIDLN